jgi:PLP dependent protein
MIADNISLLNKRISNACRRVGKSPDDIKIIAVTKRSSAEDIRSAVGHGIRAIGENRVIEASDKLGRLKDLDIERHFIGSLQANKAKLAVESFDVIQSLDSIKLAKEISIRAQSQGKVMPVMIEVNIAGEQTKHGTSPMEVEHFYHKAIAFPGIKIIGLMTIAPYVSPEETRPYFRKMKQINDILKLPYLSMGMTNDFEIAIEEGSNMIRIGTGIFG